MLINECSVLFFSLTYRLCVKFLFPLILSLFHDKEISLIFNQARAKSIYTVYTALAWNYQTVEFKSKLNLNPRVCVFLSTPFNLPHKRYKFFRSSPKRKVQFNVTASHYFLRPFDSHYSNNMEEEKKERKHVEFLLSEIHLSHILNQCPYQ